MSSLLTTWRAKVPHEWVDYNGHLRDAFYLQIFSLAVDAMMDSVGLDAAGRASIGHTFYTLEAHLNFLQEVKEGVEVEVHTQVLGMDSKRLHLYNTLHRCDNQALLAANEQMQANIDIASTRTIAFAPSVAAQLQVIARAHAALPKPAYAGRIIALPPAKPQA